MEAVKTVKDREEGTEEGTGMRVTQEQRRRRKLGIRYSAFRTRNEGRMINTEREGRGNERKDYRQENVVGRSRRERGENPQNVQQNTTQAGREKKGRMTG